MENPAETPGFLFFAPRKTAFFQCFDKITILASQSRTE